MITNSNRRNNNRVARRQRKVKNKNNKNGKALILREPGRFAPDKTRVNLVFQDPSGLRSPTGSSQALNWGYRSSAYDPDPGVLSGAIPGFAELSNLYSQYCVHAMHIELEVANTNTENMILVCWPANTLANVNSLTYADLAEYSGNVRAKSVIMGTVNSMNVCKLSVDATGLQLVGNRFKTDLDYSSGTSTNPAQMFYINCGIYHPSTTITYGLITRARIVYDVEFFKLRQLES